MRSSLAITLVILGVFLLLSPVLLPLFASAGDVKMPSMDGMGLVPMVGIGMIVVGIVGPMVGRSKSDHQAGRQA
jgi:hypothetical protein